MYCVFPLKILQMGYAMENNIKPFIAADADKIIDDYIPLLDSDVIPITPYLSLNIPSVREVLRNDRYYFSITHAFTSNPREYAVQLLDEMNIDFAQISEYDLFVIHFQSYVNACKMPNDNDNQEIKRIQRAMGLIFKDADIGSFLLFQIPELGGCVFYNLKTHALINEFIYRRMAEVIRQINLYKHDKSKCGNEAFKEYELEKQRRRLKRNRRKKYNHFFEKQIIALVNNTEFKYNYEATLDMSIYKFNQSLKQIPQLMTYYNTMHGVYAGTVDVKKINDKSVLTWLSYDEDK